MRLNDFLMHSLDESRRVDGLRTAEHSIMLVLQYMSYYGMLSIAINCKNYLLLDESTFVYIDSNEIEVIAFFSARLSKNSMREKRLKAKKKPFKTCGTFC